MRSAYALILPRVAAVLLSGVIYSGVANSEEVNLEEANSEETNSKMASPQVTSPEVASSQEPKPRAALTENLWLPGSYRDLMPKLRASAEKLQATERCDKVLQGKLHASTRDEQNAVFFLVCRDSSRKTFPVLVDANAQEFEFPLTPEPEPEPEPEPRDLEAERQAYIQRSWASCESMFSHETRFMPKMQLLSEGQVEPLEEDGSLLFVIDFDAENLQGQPLQYRAHCSVADEEAQPVLQIQPRQKALQVQSR
ncbi:hypothetical protein [Pseudomaricurvus sp.]|uniref:hypothetical protein n=1 Tax=Pseudomaricurvus sp. TaxID=2004510 RepID=UPI003F6D9F0C